MKGFLDVTSVEVPRSVINEAHSHLREVGSHGLEGFSLWAGKRYGSIFQVQTNIVPFQTAHRTPNGVCVSVGPDELHRINVWLYNHRLTLFAQLHSHPTTAYHSETDDMFPIATTLGSLSIVVPDFARRPFSLLQSAVYRLLPDCGWALVEPKDAAKLITIVENK